MIGVIWWSATGNTEEMAEAIVRGIEAAGEEAMCKNVMDVTVDEALECDALALGCPAMGDEVLEEMDFEPFFTELEGQLEGKKVVLFGSYGWGTGAWMEEWIERTANAGAEVIASVMACGAADDDITAQLEEAGEALTK